MFLKEKLLRYISEREEISSAPYYLYDTGMIREHCMAFSRIEYKEKEIHFATMANIHSDFLKIVREEGLGVFVNSLIHLEEVIKAGFEGEKMIFTSSGQSRENMLAAGQHGVQVNLDSPAQLEQWRQLFPGVPAGIRCNIGDQIDASVNHAGAFIGKNSRLGFTLEEISQIDHKSGIKGLHLYAGTDIFDLDYLFSCYEALVEISRDFPSIEYLNFGGGFGVAENDEKQFDFETYGRRLTALMESVSNSKGKKIKLILEPGRIIGGAAGYFVCKVTDIKERGDIRLVGVNASVAQFSRPLLYPDMARHPVNIIRNGQVLHESEHQLHTIFGCSTYSRDILRSKIELPQVNTGDLLVFGNAGSYCASSYCQFLGFPKPEEFFL